MAQTRNGTTPGQKSETSNSSINQHSEPEAPNPLRRPTHLANSGKNVVYNSLRCHPPNQPTLIGNQLSATFQFHGGLHYVQHHQRRSHPPSGQSEDQHNTHITPYHRSHPHKDFLPRRSQPRRKGSAKDRCQLHDFRYRCPQINKTGTTPLCYKMFGSS